MSKKYRLKCGNALFPYEKIYLETKEGVLIDITDYQNEDFQEYAYNQEVEERED